ncbi:MAG: hypothetical protein LM575_04170 [Caldimicrobium sp.]|nr:hypothetical protein [Caldimicrobium sp.]
MKQFSKFESEDICEVSSFVEKAMGKWFAYRGNEGMKWLLCMNIPRKFFDQAP